MHYILYQGTLTIVVAIVLGIYLVPVLLFLGIPFIVSSYIKKRRDAVAIANMPAQTQQSGSAATPGIRDTLKTLLTRHDDVRAFINGISDERLRVTYLHAWKLAQDLANEIARVERPRADWQNHICRTVRDFLHKKGAADLPQTQIFMGLLGVLHDRPNRS